MIDEITQATLPGTDSGTNPANSDSSGAPSNTTLEAGRAALASVTPAARGRGRPATHGKYVGQIKPKKPKQVPVAGVAQSSGPLLLEDENPAEILSDGLLDSKPPFNRELAETYADPVLDLLNEVSTEFQRMRIFRGTKSRELADAVAEKVSMSETSRKIMKLGLVNCAEKYNVDLSKSPETALIGGFLLWQMKAFRQSKEIVAEFLRQRNAAPINS